MRDMKNSGVKWIGEIPVDWKLIHFKYTHTETNVGESIDKDCWSNDTNDTVFYTAGLKNIYTTYLDFPVWKYTTSTDLLLSRNGTPYVYLPENNAVYTDHIIRTSIKKGFDKHYIRYCLQQGISNEVVNSVSLPTWSVPVWDRIIIPLPDEGTQRIISNQIDKECKKVDNLISIQEAQIEKLKAYKQSLITEVVTKGLDPNAPMKDSSVEWIGKTKANYDIIPIKSLFKIKKDIIGKEPDTVLSITQNGLRVKDISENSGQMAESYANYQIVNIGDFAMNHMDLLTGGVGISEIEGVTSPDYRVFVLKNKEMNPRYFLYVFQMYYRNKIFYAFGQGAANMGRWRLPAQNFNSIAIPVAPVEEQSAIVEYLDKKIATIEKLIAIKEEKIIKLNQYKKSLIYEYVTGKKEVVC